MFLKNRQFQPQFSLGKFVAQNKFSMGSSTTTAYKIAYQLSTGTGMVI